MSKQRSKRRGEQQGLFETPQKRPRWEALPEVARVRTIRLLVQVLQALSEKLADGKPIDEAGGHDD